jgi:H+/Cl- antiporter ClcA
MRARLAIFIALVTVIGSLAITTPVAYAYAIPLAQENQEEGGGDTESGGTDTESGEGEQGGAEGGGESDEAAEETGPPWTYQMAWISLFLLFLTLLAVGFAYYRFVATRRKHGF